ncbi:SIMPL domain-containing protein [Rhizorhabdus dicambivorans]|uniref:DUF541 domain-containing protein n=1 Tax=Rhizorhabdus dicambivorans TaxID=1850238 RepID=A0A2A4G059_9SPHN|nr:SIMPL domain-containing protein [Rhizorhabdus dicambivorans]ATE63195.1 DUF541 domain-containing protein [Rhizorhabdus dicambivorans]PCE43373.1 DUF541 domain-containing protein [Rhizorhabdus dicambivorans]
MKRLALLLLLGAALAPSGAAAQALSPVPVVAPGNAVLTVSVEGKSLQAPDLAIFNAGVTTQGNTAAAALAANSAAMERVIAQLRRAGIAERDIQTSNLTVEPVYSDPNRDAALAARYSGQPYTPPAADAAVPKIIGYRANNAVAVRQRDLKNFGRVIDTLVTAGANQVNGPSFTMDNPEPALDQARTQAIGQARARADLYARAGGLKVIRILSISESGGFYGPPPVMFARGSIAGAPSAPPPPPAPIQPGELQMTVNVTVLFELAPA